MRPPLRLGVSRCLLGEPVRYDGRDKRFPWIDQELSAAAEVVGVCPEVEVGMPVPREPLHLVGGAQGPRMIARPSDRDWTCDMRHWARDRLVRLGADDLDGFVLKARSPSCGLGDCALEDASGETVGAVDGIFAAALRRAFPLLPVAREEDLVGVEARTAFLERCRFHRRWKDLVAAGFPDEDLADLHRDALARLGPTASARLEGARHAVDAAGGNDARAAWGALLHALLAEA
jgi:uncharacterized protein YbbK (DUF523 family)